MEDSLLNKCLLAVDTEDLEQFYTAKASVGPLSAEECLIAYKHFRSQLGRRFLIKCMEDKVNTSSAAFALAVEALSDSSPLVREAGCEVLACSLNPKALPFIEQTAVLFKGTPTEDHARDAIAAIQDQDARYYYLRK